MHKRNKVTVLMKIYKCVSMLQKQENLCCRCVLWHRHWVRNGQSIFHPPWWCDSRSSFLRCDKAASEWRKVLCESAYVYTRSSFFSALVTQATRITAALPPITLVVSLKHSQKWHCWEKDTFPSLSHTHAKVFFFLQGKKPRFHFIGMAEQ